jgi:hypothetical protein
MLALGAAAAAAATAGGAPDCAGDAPGDTLLDWAVCAWRAEGAGERLAGVAGWLRTEDGSLRLEIGRDAGESPPPVPAGARLLQRAGRGWTVLAPAAGPAVLWTWGGGLDTAQARWRPRVEVVLRLLESGPGGERPSLPTGCRWLAAAPPRPGRPGRLEAAASLRWRVPPALGGRRDGAPAGSAWRRALEARGRGRGGPGEVWSAVWRGDGPGAILRLSSSRWPFTLELARPQVSRLRLPSADLWVPYWSLGELLPAAASAVPARDGGP